MREGRIRETVHCVSERLRKEFIKVHEVLIELVCDIDYPSTGVVGMSQT